MTVLLRSRFPLWEIRIPKAKPVMHRRYPRGPRRLGEIAAELLATLAEKQGATE